MSESEYIFADTKAIAELERLQLIESFCDPTSQRRILATGISTGWHCLEIGAGAGSLTNWLAQQVGQNGKVVAVDRDTRFLSNNHSNNLSNIEILESDILQLELPKHSFDLIHTRYVLIHNVNFLDILNKMLTLLKIGGWLVLEEPDFSTARAITGNADDCQAVQRVNTAINQMFASRNLDAALGVRLPALLQQQGLQNLIVENDVPLVKGGHPQAIIMQKSAQHLAEAYIATGKTTLQDIEIYCRFAQTPSTWAIYHGTVAVIGQKVNPYSNFQ